MLQASQGGWSTPTCWGEALDMKGTAHACPLTTIFIALTLNHFNRETKAAASGNG